MSFHEKRSIANIIGTVVIFTLYALWVFGKYSSGELGAENILSFWGKVLLIFIPVTIVAKIIIQIIFNIIYTATTREEGPSFSDERDKLIELKGLRVAHIIFSLGFLVAMGSIALGYSISVMFIITVFGAISEICDQISQLIHYRRGI